MQKVSGDKFVVTGGAGFIGSHLCEALLSQGKEVTSIDNYVYGTRKNIEPFLENPRFKAQNLDISDAKEIRNKLEGADVVFNLAASKCTYCRLDPHLDMRVNSGGALNIAQEAARTKVKKVVHVSTGSIYGDMPHVEDEAPYAPVSFYGVSKLAGERYFEAVRKYYDLRYSIARYYHVYGPRQKGGPKGGVIPIFIWQILHGQPIHIFGDGLQTRSFTYVDDVVDATLLLADNKDMDGEAYNVASGVKITIKEMAHTLMELMRKEVPIKYEPARAGDIHDINVSNEKIGMLGWTPFEKGLRSTIAYYREAYSQGVTDE